MGVCQKDLKSFINESNMDMLSIYNTLNALCQHLILNVGIEEMHRLNTQWQEMII